MILDRRQLLTGGAALAATPAFAAVPPVGRPLVGERRFTSKAVEPEITRVARRIADPKLRAMFIACYPNTLDTTVKMSVVDGKPNAFVITGDIPCLWLRDSAAQLQPYLHLVPRDAKLGELFRGLIARQARSILIDPYANAFMEDPAAKTNLSWALKDETEMKPGVAERKWEVDSLCYPMRLAHGYWRTTHDPRPFDALWAEPARASIRTFREQQRKDRPGPYRFLRASNRNIETMPLEGYGNPAKPVGLIHSGFRPSDDACQYPFLIPANLFALHPLLTLIAPDRVRSLVDDLIRQTQQSPYGPLVWPLQGVETGKMISWHGVSVLAEARAKGIPADYAAAWPAIRRRSFDFTAPDLDNSKARDLYDRYGFVPADKMFESVSRTQEYAYDDWASSHIARAAGATADADRLHKRSLNYRNVLDPKVGFARPHFADGSWWRDYDPIQLGHKPAEYRDYTEANGWQATFLNQHDIYGQIAHFGGDAAFEAKLDALLSAPSTLPDNAPPDISGLVGQYAHGNEPDQHAPYLYAYVGAPWKTQAMVRRLCTEMYRNDPDGIIGNDDCGQMSAWFALSALGFYPVDPVSAVYVFGSPLFERAGVALGGGRRLIVEAPGNRADTPYVTAVQWNGRPWTRSWIDHATLARGGRLTFTMSATPNRAFGRARADRPPSFGASPA